MVAESVERQRNVQQSILFSTVDGSSPGPGNIYDIKEIGSWIKGRCLLFAAFLRSSSHMRLLPSNPHFSGKDVSSLDGTT